MNQVKMLLKSIKKLALQAAMLQKNINTTDNTFFEKGGHYFTEGTLIDVNLGSDLKPGRS